MTEAQLEARREVTRRGLEACQLELLRRQNRKTKTLPDALFVNLQRVARAKGEAALKGVGL